MNLVFHAAPGIKVRGICRMMLTEMGEHVSLYTTPLNIDPENPAMPISHPTYYATYLAKRVGPYATLGLAEDTWALNEGVIDDGTFLKLTYDIDKERKEMFWASLERQRGGTITCVFDATDRIQHMFWRYTEEGHPAARGKDPGPYKNAIEEHYRHNDAFVGEVLDKLQEGDMLMVLSDHGFTSFRRGVNLNAWLLANGYLKLKEGADGSAEWLQDVDWSQTKAYALGLAGLFINQKGRESQGIVEPGEEAQKLKDELISRLNGLRDEEKDAIGIRRGVRHPPALPGPLPRRGPGPADRATTTATGPPGTALPGWWRGRSSRTTPRPGAGTTRWTRDWCPACSSAITPSTPTIPALIDIAPTILRLFGVNVPRPTWTDRCSAAKLRAPPARDKPEKAA